MSLTYPDTRPEPQPIVPEMRSREAEAWTPVYARRPVRRKGKVKSWMILAPVGALTVAALGAWALMNPGEETAAPAPADPAPMAAPALTTDPLLTEAAAPEDAVLQPPLEAAPARRWRRSPRQPVRKLMTRWSPPRAARRPKPSRPSLRH